MSAVCTLHCFSLQVCSLCSFLEFLFFVLYDFSLSNCILIFRCAQIEFLFLEDLVYVHSNLRLLSRRNEEYIETLGMRATYMEELEFLRMLLLHLMSQNWRPWLLGMLTLVLLLVKVKFEVKLLILRMMIFVFDCLVDYLLFCFSFKLVSCILISEHHGMF